MASLVLDAGPIAAAPAIGARRARRARRRGLRTAAGCLAGLAVAGLVVVLRLGGVLHGLYAIAAFVLVSLLVPTSRSLSRRILVCGCLFFGWAPVLWWWRLPLGEVGRATAVLAVSAGGLAGWVLSSPRAGERARLLLPRVRGVDMIPLGAAAVAGSVVEHYLRVSTGPHALSTLMDAWDNSAHVDMALMIRRHGATVDALGHAPDGTAWSYANYPQGFHTVIAHLMELLGSPRVGSVSAELVGYAHAMALVFIAAVTLVAAGLCSLPPLRRRPLLAVPMVSVAVFAFALGPGADMQWVGFSNFVLSCSLASAAVAAAVTCVRPLAPMSLATLGGAIVGVADTWAPLVTLALPAVVVAAMPIRRWRLPRRRTALAASAAVAVGTILAIGHVALVLRSHDIGALLDIQGGISQPPLGVVVAIALGAMAACLLVGIGVGSRFGLVQRRTCACALVPFVGLAVAAAIGLAQMRSAHRLSYYFWKYLTGVELVCLTPLLLAAATLVSAIDANVHQQRTANLNPVGLMRRRWVATVSAGTVATIATVAVSQLFGYAGPGSARLAVRAAAGVQTNRLSGISAARDNPSARRLLAATTVQDAHAPNPCRVPTANATLLRPFRSCKSQSNNECR